MVTLYVGWGPKMSDVMYKRPALPMYSRYEEDAVQDRGLYSTVTLQQRLFIIQKFSLNVAQL